MSDTLKIPDLLKVRICFNGAHSLPRMRHKAGSYWFRRKRIHRWLTTPPFPHSSAVLDPRRVEWVYEMDIPEFRKMVYSVGRETTMLFPEDGDFNKEVIVRTWGK